MKETTRHWFGDVLLLLVALIWGMGFIAVKIGLNSGTSPFYLLALRFSIAALILIPLQYKKIKTISTRAWQHGFILGIFLFLGFALQTIGLNYTTTSKNAFLTGVNVVIVPFFAWALTKKKVEKRALFAAFLTLLGMGLLTLNDSLSINIGDLLTIACAIMFAGHISVTSIIAKHEDPLTLVFIQMVSAALFSWIATFIFQESHTLSSASFIAILYLGVFSTLLAFVLQTIGQKYAHAAKSAILLSTESLFGAIFAVIIFKDPLSIQMVAGCLVILSAIFISESQWHPFSQ